MTACTQPACTGTIVDGYCDLCGSPAGGPPFIAAVAAASAASPAHAARTGLTAGGRGSGLPTRPRDCTQRGCIGTIVDGYCDVCGSPPGAAPFIPARAAASAASPAPAARTGLTAATQGSGFPPRPKNCTQRGCIGTIVDGYCDVCGSPADVVPFVAAASAESPAPANEPGLTAVPASTPPRAPVNEEIPTQRLPRVKMPRQQLSKQEMADSAATDPVVVDAQKVGGEKVDPAADDTEKVDGKKELAVDESDGARDYRTRVEEAQLPHDVREAALCEVGKLERTSDQSPESRDIRIWLDTILDLPWSAEVTDSIDIQGSREVEATLRRLIEPAVADVEEADTAEVEPPVADVEAADTAEVERPVADVEAADTAEVERPVADVEAADTAEVERPVADVEAADTAEVEPPVADVEDADTAEVEPPAPEIEKADTAPAGLQQDDTVEMPGVPAPFSRGRHLLPGWRAASPSLLAEARPQPPEQQVLGPEPVQGPANKKRFGSLALAATILAALLIGALFFANRDVGGVAAQSDATVTATATMPVSKQPSARSDESTDTGRGESIIQLEDLAASARPFEAVRIQGTYRGGAGTFLRVQRWDGGKWLDFPLPTKTDQSGRFITQAEFGQPGRYRLRVLDPDSGVTSETFVVMIRG
jgi:hypothetical protein